MPENQQENQKKVSFKIQFSQCSLAQELPVSEPKMVSQWQYDRIAAAVIIVVLIVFVAIKLMTNSEQVSAIEKSKIVTESVSLANRQVTNSNHEHLLTANPDQGILRSQLAIGVWENEPFGKVILPLKVNSRAATGLFYFTELQGLQGQPVYHIWKQDGRIVFQQKSRVSSRRFRTYTSKLFTMASIGPWTVSITDSELVPLHMIKFAVVAE